MAGLNTIVISGESEDILNEVRDDFGKRKMGNGKAIELALQKLKTYMDNDPKLKGK
jgi:hypothetical protein